MQKLLSLALAAAAVLLAGCEAVVLGAAVGTTASVVEDRRTTGIYVEDQNIEVKAANRIAKKLGDDAHVNVTSFNRLVLLTGEAPTEQMRADAEAVARTVENVRDVVNEIAVAGKTALSARANDGYITSKVKARHLDSGKFQVNHVKVVTEGGVVYLMGLVKRKEADDAVEIARTTGGVRKVVKVFEYLD